MAETSLASLEPLIEHPCPLVFATLSGAHLYGFPSRDSDYDVRGAHILPLPEVVGLTPTRETFERTMAPDGRTIDVVTHDVRKFFSLLLKRNGYVLEQLYSPLIIVSSPAHVELQDIAARCVTRGHAENYLGFAESQWRLLTKQGTRAKPLLYVFRVLLTGIHLMRTGRVQANLVELNHEFKLPYIDELIALKVAGSEDERLPEGRTSFFEGEYHRLREVLAHAAEGSRLPEHPSARAELNDLLIRLRLKGSGP